MTAPFAPPSDLLALVPIATAAGAAIMEHYAGVVATTMKADASPLTAADLAAEAVIAVGLGRLDPSTPVISEESKAVPWDERKGWREHWLVDPLDGTKEFLAKNGEFTVNIARVRDGAPLGGVVVAPALGMAYVGGAGIGAWRQDARGAWRPIRVASTGPRVRVVASRSHRDTDTEVFIRRLEARGTPVDVVSKGSSLKLCMVAEGAADVYPRFGPTSWWDTAAAHAVVEGAGGLVRRADGGALRYAGPDLLNPAFVAAADAALLR